MPRNSGCNPGPFPLLSLFSFPPRIPAQENPAEIELQKNKSDSTNYFILNGSFELVESDLFFCNSISAGFSWAGIRGGNEKSDKSGNGPGLQPEFRGI